MHKNDVFENIRTWLISSNPFDIVGARSMGMNAIWVDRAGVGWKAAVVPDLQPTATVNSLEHIVATMSNGLLLISHNFLI
jgi:FMN phosphatase YigB (HAD superfamily)